MPVPLSIFLGVFILGAFRYQISDTKIRREIGFLDALQRLSDALESILRIPNTNTLVIDLNRLIFEAYL